MNDHEAFSQFFEDEYLEVSIDWIVEETLPAYEEQVYADNFRKMISPITTDSFLHVSPLHRCARFLYSNSRSDQRFLFSVDIAYLMLRFVHHSARSMISLAVQGCRR